MTSTASSASSFNSANSNLYNLYVQDVIKLARTVVIKLDQIAQAMNNLVLLAAGPGAFDPSDRTTWKYYQNISGVYNAIDTPMYVESLDGNGQISFNKTTLQSNPITQVAYAYDSYYYNELVTKYPDQEMLILGILYPADMTTAINSVDGTILSYPSFLVEEAETDLIVNLQSWVQNFLSRWVVLPFSSSDNLYVATYFGQLVLNLVPAIMNLRLQACKTNQAHSFHIGQYLRSHGFLDFYLAELTQEQTLDFYRNINYYVRNAGFSSTFATLIDLLMTKRQLPVYEYNFHHNTAAIHYVTPSDTSNIAPKAIFSRDPINSVAQSSPLADYNLRDVYAMIDQAAPGNDLYQQANQDLIEQTLDYAAQAYLKTKIVEVGLPPNQSNYITPPDTLIFNQWLAMAAASTYSVQVQFTPPGSTVPINLSQQQAVALWIYAMTKALQPAHPASDFEQLTNVPQVIPVGVVNPQVPDFAALRALADTTLISDDQINQAIALAPPTSTGIHTSITDFYNYCSTVYSAMNAQRRLYSTVNDPIASAQLEAVCAAFYGSWTANLTSLTTTTNPYQGALYSTVLTDVDFTPTNYSALDYYNLTIALFEAATGAHLNAVNNPINVQTAMVELLKQLCSYSVLIVTNVESIDTTPFHQPDIRFYNYRETETTHGYVSGAELFDSVIIDQEMGDISYDWNVQYPLQLPQFGETDTATLQSDENETETFSLEPSTSGYLDLELLETTDQDPYALFAALTSTQQQALFALMPPK